MTVIDNPLNRLESERNLIAMETQGLRQKMNKRALFFALLSYLDPLIVLCLVRDH